MILEKELKLKKNKTIDKYSEFPLNILPNNQDNNIKDKIFFQNDILAEKVKPSSKDKDDRFRDNKKVKKKKRKKKIDNNESNQNTDNSDFINYYNNKSFFINKDKITKRNNSRIKSRK